MIPLAIRTVDTPVPWTEIRNLALDEAARIAREVASQQGPMPQWACNLVATRIEGLKSHAAL